MSKLYRKIYGCEVAAVNACNSEQAAQDAINLGRIKGIQSVPGNYALEVAAAITAGAACAFMPNVTVDDIIETALDQLSSVPRQEVQQGLKWADEYREIYENQRFGFG